MLIKNCNRFQTLHYKTNKLFKHILVHSSNCSSKGKHVGEKKYNCTIYSYSLRNRIDYTETCTFQTFEVLTLKRKADLTLDTLQRTMNSGQYSKIVYRKIIQKGQN